MKTHKMAGNPISDAEREYNRNYYREHREAIKARSQAARNLRTALDLHSKRALQDKYHVVRQELLKNSAHKAVQITDDKSGLIYYISKAEYQANWLAYQGEGYMVKVS